MKIVNFPKVIIFLVVALFLTVAVVIYAQQKTDKESKSEMCPMMEKQADKNKSHGDCPMKKGESPTSEKKTDDMSNHSDHYKMVMENGEKAMGFSQTATTHRFLIM